MLNKEEKTKIIGDFKRDAGDTGSVEVQVALITKRIEELTAHFKDNKKDYASKRGMYKLISRRKSLLKYLEGKSPERAASLKERLGLRR